MQTNRKGISLLYPNGEYGSEQTLSVVTIHDLGLDAICSQLTTQKAEQNRMISIMAKMTKDPSVAKYRCDIFEDVHRNREMREELLKILDQIHFLKEYGSMTKTYEEASGMWDLMHRLDELQDYIRSVEALFTCLSKADLQSDGLLELKRYVRELYEERGFEELRQDIAHMKATTSNLKSVTLGINLNERLEAASVGIISVNNKMFSKSNVLGTFCDKISSRSGIQSGTEWNETYRYHPIGQEHPSAHVGLAWIPDGDGTDDVMRYMNRVTDQLLSTTVKALRNLLQKYVSVTIAEMTDLIPEFLYYVRWAEYIETLQKQGFSFCKGVPLDKQGEPIVDAKGIYNLKLATAVTAADEVVVNDLQFDREHLVYILTGANRGGKTTITQAIGLLFVLAQGGIFVPGEGFAFTPVDCIYTHFPADEDQTVHLGRLGEECQRFRELYQNSTEDSLLLLNETFSTTSFEEGYYIAKDSVKAILTKGARTIYNTHMHKLAADLDEINAGKGSGLASSLVMESDGGKRSYVVKIAPPEGISYANDIAKKYGVTYEMLVGAKGE